MERLGAYLIGIASCAFLCSIVNCIADKCTAGKQIIRLITGITLSVCVLRPLVNFQWKEMVFLSDPVFSVADEAALDGMYLSIDAQKEIIISRTETYIQNKAVSMDVDLEVEVVLDGKAPYKPVSVIIWGETAPFAKGILADMIESDLGVPMEAQQWMG